MGGRERAGRERRAVGPAQASTGKGAARERSANGRSRRVVLLGGCMLEMGLCTAPAASTSHACACSMYVCMYHVSRYTVYRETACSIATLTITFREGREGGVACRHIVRHCASLITATVRNFRLSQARLSARVLGYRFFTCCGARGVGVGVGQCAPSPRWAWTWSQSRARAASRRAPGARWGRWLFRPSETSHDA